MIGRRKLLTASIGTCLLAGCVSRSGAELQVASRTFQRDDEQVTATYTISNGGVEEGTATLTTAVDVGGDGMYGTVTTEREVSVDAEDENTYEIVLASAGELSRAGANALTDGYIVIRDGLDGQLSEREIYGEVPDIEAALRVIYPTDWSVEYNGTTQAGEGEELLPIAEDTTTVSATVQKADSLDDYLTGQIIVDGAVIAEQRTTEPFGQVQLTASLIDPIPIPDPEEPYTPLTV